MLTGENGIINKAQYAKDENIKAQIVEEINLAIESIKIQDTKDNILTELTKNKISKELSNFQLCSADNATINENESNDERKMENGDKIYLSKKNSDANDLIATITFYINDNNISIKDITLSNEKLSFLVDEVDIGSYVYYPVEYSNTIDFDSSFLVGEYKNEINGWRVIDKNGSGESGRVTLISAGVPLRMYHSKTDSSEVLPILNNLYKILPQKKDNNLDYFTESGFKNKEFDLTKIFNTGYENKDSILSFCAEEAINLYNNIMGNNVVVSQLPTIRNVFQSSEMSLNKDDVMKDLLGCGMTYWLATVNEEKTTELYDVYGMGFVYYNSYCNYGIRVVLELMPGLKTKNAYTGLDNDNAYIIF